MIERLDWKGPVSIEGQDYDSLSQAILSLNGFSGELCVYLKANVPPERDTREHVRNTEICVTVRSYMTKPPTTTFDFHDRWNEGHPMPLRTMTGRVIAETKGMVKMELHGVAQQTDRCMRCGRLLTHPVSLKYGIGPECGGHFHIDPESQSLEEIRKSIEDITWTGWIIKSAIIEEDVL